VNEQLTLSEDMGSSNFCGIRVAQSLIFCVMLCKSLFVSFVLFYAIALSVSEIINVKFPGVF
jgi:hypothetical protein